MVNNLECSTFFSIIIPVYKTDLKYFSECLKSVANQVFRNFEVILVFDGDNENYDLYFKNIKKHFDVTKIKILKHTQNQGLSASRNNGINVAEGEFIIHLDSDDFWRSTDTLKYIHEIIKCDECDILRFNGVYLNGNKIGGRLVPAANLVNSSVSLSPELRQYRSIYLFVIKRDFIIKNNLYLNEKISIGEDKYYVSKVLSRTEKVSSIPNTFYGYRIHHTSMMQSSWTMREFQSENSSFEYTVKHFENNEIAIKDYFIYRYSFYIYASLLPNMFFYNLPYEDVGKLVRDYLKQMEFGFKNGLLTKSIRVRSLSFVLKLLAYNVYYFYFAKHLFCLNRWLYKRAFLLKKGFNNPILSLIRRTTHPIKKAVNKVLRKSWNFYHKIRTIFTNYARRIFKAKPISVIENKENFVDYNINYLSLKDLKPGLSVMLRAKNEERLICQSIESIIDIFDEITFIDNNSDDKTLEVVENLKHTHHLGHKINIFSYPFYVSPCGKAHNETEENSVHSLAYYYNWCKSKCQCEFIMKWDADMLLDDDALTIENMNSTLDSLKGNRVNWVIRTPVQTVYKSEKNSWLSINEIHSEPRIFRNTPRNNFKKGVNFEILSIGDFTKTIKLKDVKIYEIKELNQPEFDHWSSLTFISPRKVTEYRNFRRLTLGLNSDLLQLMN